MTLLLLAAVLVDYRLGDPHGWPHPVIFIGRLVNFFHRGLKRYGLDSRVWGGVLWLLTMALTLAGLSFLLKGAYALHPIIGHLMTLYFMYASLAATCMKKEVDKVLEVIDLKDLNEARVRIGYLVGRDTKALSKEDILKATIETSAESTIDGVLAPLFYGLVGIAFGQPALFMVAYKAVNTMDSMLGYIQEPYTRIGYVAAKMDDIFNFIPARIGSLFMLLAGGYLTPNIMEGFKVYKSDRLAHKSPNAGHPEAIVAGLLGVTLGGTNQYFGQVLVKPTIGNKAGILTKDKVQMTLKIMYLSEFMMVILGITILTILGY